MTSALQLKYYVQGLSAEEAIPTIHDFLLGEDWRNGFDFSDGSSVSIYFVNDELSKATRCVVHCFDAEGSGPKPAVRAKFTCDYLPEETYVEAYFTGQSNLSNQPVPYFLYRDVMGMKDLLSEVKVLRAKEPVFNGRDVFEILPPGYDWGEHITAGGFLLDLGDRVIEVYAIGGADWNWRPLHDC